MTGDSSTAKPETASSGNDQIRSNATTSSPMTTSTNDAQQPSSDPTATTKRQRSPETSDSSLPPPAKVTKIADETTDKATKETPSSDAAAEQNQSSSADQQQQLATANKEKQKERNRAKLAWKRQVLAGETQVQRQAAAARQLRLVRQRREPGFCYVGDSVVIWNLHEFAQNHKWREDAIRKSRRRKAQQVNGSNSHCGRGVEHDIAVRREMFRAWIEKKQDERQRTNDDDCEDDEPIGITPKC